MNGGEGHADHAILRLVYPGLRDLRYEYTRNPLGRPVPPASAKPVAPSSPRPPLPPTSPPGRSAPRPTVCSNRPAARRRSCSPPVSGCAPWARRGPPRRPVAWRRNPRRLGPPGGAAAGRARVAGQDRGGRFLRPRAGAEFDAVIGNPPYVRYQNFAGEARARAQRAALAAGVRLTGLSSSWAAFTIHASRFLRPEGRLALVLPGELLTVNYAAQVRRFLLRRFARVRLVLFDTRVFPGVLEEVCCCWPKGRAGRRASSCSRPAAPRRCPRRTPRPGPSTAPRTARNGPRR